MAQQRSIIHIDMDAFFASVEQMDNPQLKGKPIVVGGQPQERGVVAAASYQARKFGIHSAMPTYKAIKLCPQLVICPVRMSRYSELSRQINKIFYDFCPQIEPISLDEAFLDVTGSLKLFKSAENIGQQIKQRIKTEIGLTASVGIAPNKFLAKLASDIEKPDGFVIITEQNKQQTLDPLPVNRIWGIGKKTAQTLNNRGIKTIKQLRTLATKYLKPIFGNCTDDIIALANGIDDRAVIPARQAKSVSAEQTFATDILEKDTLLKVLHSQVEEVSCRLREMSFEGKTITLKFRYRDFKTITRSASFDSYTNTTQTLWTHATKVFNDWHCSQGSLIRLLGFGVSNLRQKGTGQQMLFESPKDIKQEKIDTVFDKIRDKYGRDKITRSQ